MATSRVVANGKKVSKGDPISKKGLNEVVNDLQKAVLGLEVKGENGITARIDWAGGTPRIIIKYTG